MHQQLALSIIIINWNTRDLLMVLLQRLFTAPRCTFEVIVVDNQSADGSAEAAANAFPAAIVLPQPKNGGFSYGVNRGLERARGELILLLNTDAEADWEQLHRLVQAAERERDVAVIGPRIVDEHGNVQSSAWPRHRPGHYLPYALFLGRFIAAAQPTVATDVDCVSGCVFLIRAKVLGQLGGFDERFFMYYEEADFCERVRTAGHRLRWVPDATFVHEGGLSAAQAAERTFVAFRESCLLYHAQWHGRAWTEYVRACLVLGHTLRLLAWCVAGLLGKRSRAPLYRAALRRLLRPGYVGELCRRPRQVPALPHLA